MRRRSFLAAIAAAFVAPDPERLLWQPGKKLISIPAPKPIVVHQIRKVAWCESLFEDVTSHADGPWRRMLITGIRVHFEDGSTTVLPPDSPL